MTYDINGHTLLSDEVGALSSAELTAQIEAAEDLLDLTDTTYVDKNGRLARLALVHQVNHQVSAGPDAEVLRREVQGDRTREVKRDGVPLVSRRAQRVVAQIDTGDEDGDTTPTPNRSTTVSTHVNW